MYNKYVIIKEQKKLKNVTININHTSSEKYSPSERTDAILKETVIDSKMNMSRRWLCISETTMTKATFFRIYEEKGTVEEINGWKKHVYKNEKTFRLHYRPGCRVGYVLLSNKWLR